MARADMEGSGETAPLPFPSLFHAAVRPHPWIACHAIQGFVLAYESWNPLFLLRKVAFS
jgi:hypothetical protein